MSDLKPGDAVYLKATVREFMEQGQGYPRLIRALEGGSYWAEDEVIPAIGIDHLRAELAAVMDSATRAHEDWYEVRMEADSLRAELAEWQQKAGGHAAVNLIVERDNETLRDELAAISIDRDRLVSRGHDVAEERDELRKRVGELEARVVAQANEWRIAYNELHARAERAEVQLAARDPSPAGREE
jgi:chromosome segregation ATPase